MDIKFIIKLLGLTAILTLLTAAFLYFVEVEEPTWYWVSLGFFLILGLLIGWRTNKAVTSESNSNFFVGVMSGTGLRMLFCLIFIAIYLVMSEVRDTKFVVCYLFLYLFYTIFEIYQLVSKLRTEKRSNIDNTTS